MRLNANDERKRAHLSHAGFSLITLYIVSIFPEKSY